MIYINILLSWKFLSRRICEKRTIRIIRLLKIAKPKYDCARWTKKSKIILRLNMGTIHHVISFTALESFNVVFFIDIITRNCRGRASAEIEFCGTEFILLDTYL